MVSLIKALACMLLFATAVHAEELSCDKQMKPNGIPIALMDQPFKAFLTADVSGKSGIAPAVILIDGGAQRYCVETAISSDSANPPMQKETLEREGHRQVKWHSPYLLVQSDESTRIEVANKTWVFKAANGTLIRLGALGGDVMEEKSGRFLSLYNKAPVWRATAFGCTACKPKIHLAIDDLDGKLVANAEATWRLNEAERKSNYEYADSQIRAGLPPLEEDVPTRSLVLGALIENAVIAKYCGRASEMDKVVALANAHLDPASQNDLAQALSAVVPLETPDQWGARSE